MLVLQRSTTDTMSLSFPAGGRKHCQELFMKNASEARGHPSTHLLWTLRSCLHLQVRRYRPLHPMNPSSEIKHQEDPPCLSPRYPKSSPPQALTTPSPRRHKSAPSPRLPKSAASLPNPSLPQALAAPSPRRPKSSLPQVSTMSSP